MDVVIAVRHGEYSGSSLIEQGRMDIANLAKIIKQKIGEDTKIHLFHSPETRAVESAEIIAETLGCDLVECEMLSMDTFSAGRRMKENMVENVGDRACDVLIAVTHYDAPAGIIHYFRRDLYAEGYNFGGELSKGEALFLDVKDNVTGKLPH
jgi:phosphohistidine phosphatase SixA